MEELCNLYKHAAQ